MRERREINDLKQAVRSVKHAAEMKRNRKPPFDHDAYRDLYAKTLETMGRDALLEHFMQRYEKD